MLTFVIAFAILVAVLWISAALAFNNDETGAGVSFTFLAVLLNVLVIVFSIAYGDRGARGKVSDVGHTIEDGRIYRLVSRFPGQDDKSVGLILDDGAGNIFAVWSQPIPEGAQYFQKSKTTKSIVETHQLIPVIPPAMSMSSSAASPGR